ncbi:MAG: hypothetical protein NNA19_05130 [Nitrospira sp.]|nr:hypothetical protein [Nitrospira sp.]MCP9474616.1 hypothetical protein [Nitrospira sp.]
MARGSAAAVSVKTGTSVKRCTVGYFYIQPSGGVVMSKLRSITLVFACLAGMSLSADADEIGKIRADVRSEKEAVKADVMGKKDQMTSGALGQKDKVQAEMTGKKEEMKAGVKDKADEMKHKGHVIKEAGEEIKGDVKGMGDEMKSMKSDMKGMMGH